MWRLSVDRSTTEHACNRSTSAAESTSCLATQPVRCRDHSLPSARRHQGPFQQGAHWQDEEGRLPGAPCSLPSMRLPSLSLLLHPCPRHAQLLFFALWPIPVVLLTSRVPRNPYSRASIHNTSSPASTCQVNCSRGAICDTEAVREVGAIYPGKLP